MPFLSSKDPDVLLALLSDPHFGEREALLLLSRKDLPEFVIQELAGLRSLAGSHAVRLGLARHPRTPLRTALEQLKFLYLFDLVSVCLQPAIPAAVKGASEALILAQIPKLPIGQRLTLAKRGPARIAASLLKGENARIIEAVLDNPCLTEAALLTVLSQPDCPARIVQAIAAHQRWGVRGNIRLALLRQPGLPFACALSLLTDLKLEDVRSIARDSRVLPQVRNYLSNRMKGSRTRT